MKPNIKSPNRKTKKAAAEEQPAEPATQIKTTGGFLWSRGDEELVDYDEVEEPATFSPAEEENYSEGDEYPAHTNGPEDEIDNTDEFLAFFAEAVDSLGGKRSQIFFRRGSTAARRAGVSALAAPNKKIVIKQLAMIRWIWRPHLREVAYHPGARSLPYQVGQW